MEAFGNWFECIPAESKILLFIIVGAGGLWLWVVSLGFVVSKIFTNIFWDNEYSEVGFISSGILAILAFVLYALYGMIKCLF